MKRISTKRKATAKLQYNSTFSVPEKMTAEAFKRSGLVSRVQPKGETRLEVEAGGKNGPKVRDKKYWKGQADKYFSEFIRLRDSDEHGIATCITSGVRKHWRQFDCGHYISRAKESTRYDERNCNAQSKMSNRFQGGHFHEHAIAIDRKYGEGTAAKLHEKAGQPCRRTLGDYQFLALTYKSRVARIKELQPDKYFRGK